jgi:hypothetical protein
MSTQMISKSLFILEPVKTGGYELCIKFLDKAESLVSAKKFTFSLEQPIQGAKEESKASHNKEASENELLDVYSQNGVCGPSILTSLFSKGDEQGVKKAAQMLKASALKGPTVFVLDLKDPETGYKDNATGTITKCESAVCEFFKSKIPCAQAGKHAKKIHKSAPDFVLCEGHLKMDLLKCGGFSGSEIDYFHTPSGAKSFCQCTEFFMNAFKMGETAVGEKGALLADKYIVPISGKFNSFKPCTKSTVLYPALYKDIYSIQGEFAKVLSTVYSVSGKYDVSSKITTMSVTR